MAELGSVVRRRWWRFLGVRGKVGGGGGGGGGGGKGGGEGGRRKVDSGGLLDMQVALQFAFTDVHLTKSQPIT